MDDLKSVIDEAEREGLIFLNDIVNFVISKLPDLAVIKTRSIIKTRVYNVLKEKDKNEPSLVDLIDSIIK